MNRPLDIRILAIGNIKKNIYKTLVTETEIIPRNKLPGTVITLECMVTALSHTTAEAEAAAGSLGLTE